MKTELWRTIAAGGTALAIPGLAGAATVVTQINATYTSSALPGGTQGFAENADGTFTATADGTGDFAFVPNDLGAMFISPGATLIADDADGNPINFLPGDLVGPSSPVTWGAGGWLVLPKAGSTKGNFAVTGNGWVGFAIPNGSDVNYGAVSLSNVATGSVTVNEIEFDTVANDPLLITPEPSTLGLLALGAAGLLALRKRRKA
jgi:hypothetical protein